MTIGISAHDRARTILAAIDSRTRPEDLAGPGGVLERRGQTEAAAYLARLAGLHPSGDICEIMNDDGSMARVPALAHICMKHDLKMITVADLARYRLESESEELWGWLGW